MVSASDSAGAASAQGWRGRCRVGSCSGCSSPLLCAPASSGQVRPLCPCSLRLGQALPVRPLWAGTTSPGLLPTIPSWRLCGQGGEAVVRAGDGSQGWWCRSWSRCGAAVGREALPLWGRGNQGDQHWAAGLGFALPSCSCPSLGACRCRSPVPTAPAAASVQNLHLCEGYAGPDGRYHPGFYCPRLTDPATHRYCCRHGPHALKSCCSQGAVEALTGVNLSSLPVPGLLR